tara:strand:+ start:469 stop:654 length:186 start_codon:yes stop_codon:yes gene_type:complete
MEWGSLNNFLIMGGYHWYVWGSYGLSFILLFIEILVLFRLLSKVSKRSDFSEEISGGTSEG